jgi:hypothetical protein
LCFAVNGSTTWGLSYVALNPGNTVLGTWLAQQAESYDQYRFRSLKFVYVPKVPTSYTGQIQMGCDYDVTDPFPNSERTLSQYQGTVIDAAWREIEFNCDVSALNSPGPRKYVELLGSGVSPLPPVPDYNQTSFGGNFFLAAVGCSDTSEIGKLYAEYDVDLFVPQSPSSGSIPSVRYALTLQRTGAAVNITTGANSLLPMPQTAATIPEIIGSGGTFAYVLGANTITLPQGVWHFSCSWQFGNSVGTTSNAAILAVMNPNLTAAGSGAVIAGNALPAIAANAVQQVSMDFYYVSDGVTPIGFVLSGINAGPSPIMYGTTTSAAGGFTYFPTYIVIEEID